MLDLENPPAISEGLLSPSQLLDDAPQLPTTRPYTPLPDVRGVSDDVSSNPSAKQLDEVGQAMRAALGIGALALLPGLIEDLQHSRDPDTRIKFLQLAFKEGGYGVKEDKTANLPVFHFNFVGGAPTNLTVERHDTQNVEDATYAKAPADAYNDDFLPPSMTPVQLAPDTLFDLIEGI